VKTLCRKEIEDVNTINKHTSIGCAYPSGRAV